MILLKNSLPGFDHILSEQRSLESATAARPEYLSSAPPPQSARNYVKVLILSTKQL
jgi:hypothetical protein